MSDTELDAELRKLAERVVSTLTPLLPLTGSWNEGYSVADHIDPTVMALPEEWGDASLAVADLHGYLTGRVA